MNFNVWYAISAIAVMLLILTFFNVYMFLKWRQWGKPGHVIEVLESLTEDVETLREDVDTLKEQIAQIPGRWRVARYDAIPEEKGKKSSTLAVINEYGDGWVITSLTMTGASRVYIKNVRGWKCEEPFSFSPEEELAIESIKKEI
ncbi:DUF4446 family protein [bacterium 3DAC]|nr:DUF4446 family protein [Dictyoglomota bacterium]UZN23340.1 DUF4446 family protein [bacterium 3DAC]